LVNLDVHVKIETMNILVNHQISDPDAYWGALSANPPVPEGFKVVSFMAGTDPGASACLWSAPDVDSLKALVDKTVGHASSNSYMVINDSKSFGI
jgi:hypothetical protein